VTVYDSLAHQEIRDMVMAMASGPHDRFVPLDIPLDMRCRKCGGELIMTSCGVYLHGFEEEAFQGCTPLPDAERI
jgi:hypothetical protein